MAYIRGFKLHHNDVPWASWRRTPPLTRRYIQYLNQYWAILNWTLETNSMEILIKTRSFSFMKMHLKISSAKWRPFCPGWDKLMICSGWIDKCPCYNGPAFWNLCFISIWLGWDWGYLIYRCMSQHMQLFIFVVGIPHTKDDLYFESETRVISKAPRQSYCRGASEAGLILGVRLTNERRRYFVTTSPIGWARA